MPHTPEMQQMILCERAIPVLSHQRGTQRGTQRDGYAMHKPAKETQMSMQGESFPFVAVENCTLINVAGSPVPESAF